MAELEKRASGHHLACARRVALALCMALAAGACDAAPAPQPTAVSQSTLSVAQTPAPTGGAEATQPEAQMVTCIEMARLLGQTWSAPFAWYATTFQDPLHGAAMTPGCAARASGSGADFSNVAGAYNVIAATLKAQRWREDTRYQAGGPTGAAGGFRKGEHLCLASMEWVPSGDANCPADKSIETCELKPEQRIYTLRLQCGLSTPLKRDHVVLAADEKAPDQPSAYLDLDSGAIGDTANGDIALALSSGSAVVQTLIPTNGATAYAAGKTEPGFEGCRKAQDAGAYSSTDILDLSPGSYICVMTDKANLVVLRIDAAGRNTVEVSFTTEDPP